MTTSTAKRTWPTKRSLFFFQVFRFPLPIVLLLKYTIAMFQYKGYPFNQGRQSIVSQHCLSLYIFYLSILAPNNSHLHNLRTPTLLSRST